LRTRADDGVLTLQLCKADKVRAASPEPRAAPSCSLSKDRTCLLRGVGAWGDARARRPARQGEPWAAALAGHALDPLRQQSEQKRLLLERFQEEARPRAASRCGKALSPASKRERTPPLHTVTLCSAVSPHASRSA